MHFLLLFFNCGVSLVTRCSNLGNVLAMHFIFLFCLQQQCLFTNFRSFVSHLLQKYPLEVELSAKLIFGIVKISV